MFSVLLILLIIFLLWPWITRWLQRFMAHSAEDMLRRMAGAPSRKEEQKRRKENSDHRNKSTRNARRHPAKILNEVAEDVEYTEIVEYSETDMEIGTGPEYHRRIYRESQVEDVKFTEIKVSKK